MTTSVPAPFPEHQPESQREFTLGKGTSHLPAFCLRFCLMVLLKTLALSTCKASIESLSAAARMKKYVAVKKTSAKVNRLE